MSKQFASVSSKITRLALGLSKDNNTLGKLRNTFLTKHLIDHIGSENTIHVHIGTILGELGVTPNLFLGNPMSVWKTLSFIKWLAFGTLDLGLHKMVGLWDP
jgi:hypothetical protein